MNTFFESFPKADITESNRVLHTPSSFAKNSLFYVQEAGSLKSLKSHLSSRSGLDSFLFLIVISGKGTVTINQKAFPLQQNDCAWIDCKQSYSHQSSEASPWELMWIHFNGPMAQAYYDYYLENFEENTFHAESASDFAMKITYLIDIHKQKDYNTELLASKLITDILTLCFTTSKKFSANDHIFEKLEQVRNYIHTHYRTKLSLDHLSEQFFISKFHLSREFRQRYGTTIGNYILSQRITYAKELLRFTNHSIESIAESCGIPDTSYFNKVFRKYENMTASQYRKNWVHK